jgi:hypothetical protein
VDLPKGYEGYELNVKKMRRSHKEKSAWKSACCYFDTE